MLLCNRTKIFVTKKRFANLKRIVEVCLLYNKKVLLKWRDFLEYAETKMSHLVKATFVFISVIMALVYITLFIAVLYFKNLLSLGVLLPPNTVQT